MIIGTIKTLCLLITILAILAGFAACFIETLATEIKNNSDSHSDSHNKYENVIIAPSETMIQLEKLLTVVMTFGGILLFILILLCWLGL